MNVVANLIQFSYLSLFPAISDSQWIPAKPWLPRVLRGVRCIALIRVLLPIGSFLFFTLHHPQNGTNWFAPFSTFLIVIFLIGEACDLVVIAFTRWTLRRISVTKEISGILLSVGMLFLLLLAIIALPIVIGLKIVGQAQYVGLAFLLSIALNSLDVVVVFAALVVGILWLGLHLIWPLIQRPLYAFQRIDIASQEEWKKSKKWLRALAVILLCAAIPGLPSWVKELFAK